MSQRHGKDVSIKKQSTLAQNLSHVWSQSHFPYYISHPFGFSLTSVSPPHTLGNNSSRSWTQRPFSTWGGMMTNSLFTSTHRPLELRQKTVLVSAIERRCWVSVGCDVFRCEVVVKIYELLAAFSLLGELGEEEEEEEGEKFIPDNPGGSVAVFCPLRLFLHTGHVSCCSSHGTIQSL